ncbi:hypothetical protein CAFEA_03940 [Corynebacterium afermentans subsp. afermentans]|uniref:Uncharacterized protein n=1 Tax=Corynebacterium afermentans TaxID=38286 RepID=A0A9X8R3S9_9CORY|nr:hypothetical protein [Corynebacterium afermentans]WJY56402.1 hypothetical protein CAFEA_03940 [Corynebacterium afermentans subsp. afermentans]SIQ26262.1 hypothetical protein SAMN05421802_10996 [Corynebacterium afermentans]
MPDARELTRMLKDFQELIPAVVGAIVALATAIGLLVPSLEGGSSNIGGADNGGTTNSQGGYSKPGAAGVKYLTDNPTSFHDRKIKSGMGVTVNGKEYEKSILSTDGEGGGRVTFKKYHVADTARTLNLKAAWVDTIPNSGGTGKVTVERDGQLLGTFTVPAGQVVERTLDVRGGGRVTVYLTAHDPKDDQKRVPSSGLAVLTPVVK